MSCNCKNTQKETYKCNCEAGWGDIGKGLDSRSELKAIVNKIVILNGFTEDLEKEINEVKQTVEEMEEIPGIQGDTYIPIITNDYFDN